MVSSGALQGLECSPKVDPFVMRVSAALWARRLSMKKKQGKRHTPEQIIRKLREAESMIAADKTIGQVCQSLEISEHTFHRWRKQYGGMKAWRLA